MATTYRSADWDTYKMESASPHKAEWAECA